MGGRHNFDEYKYVQDCVISKRHSRSISRAQRGVRAASAGELAVYHCWRRRRRRLGVGSPASVGRGLLRARDRQRRRWRREARARAAPVSVAMEPAGEPASAAVDLAPQPGLPLPEDEPSAPPPPADRGAMLDEPPPEQPPPMEPPPEESLPPPPTVVAVQSPPPQPEKSEKHRYHEEEQEGEWQCGHWFEYVLVVALAALLLLAALVLTLFWALYYREGFAWSDDHVRQFNLHPVLMVAGFVTFSGFSVLLYRVCRCCRRLHVKLFHTIFHALAIPCIVVGFWAALDWHNLQQPALPNFHTLHSWMGLVTMGLFALQFVVGFFSFLILLCCEGATAAFRASLVPIHASFGITTFMLAIATCLTGLTQKSYERFGSSFYPTSWSEEGIIINALAMVLVALGILVSYTVRREGSRGEGKTFLSERL